MMSGTWLSAEVATELATDATALKLPVEAIALLSAVVEARSFRSLYGDSATSPRLWEGSLDAFPPKDQIGATGPDGRPTHTFGAWQWEPQTADDIAVGIGTPSVSPENQIRGSWWLAQRDFRTHGGTDLLADLGAAGHDVAALDAIAARLHPTWPGGARPGFSDRYLAALSSAPPAAIEIPLGERCTLAILVATDRSGVPIPIAEIPADLLRPDDPTICSVAIDSSGVGIDPLALGSTILRGADQTLSVNVVQRIVVHLQLDLAHPVFAPIVVAMRAVALSTLAIFPLMGMGSSTAIEPAPHAEPFAWERSPPSFRLVPDSADPLGQHLLVEPISK